MFVSVLGPLHVRNDDGESIPVAGTRLRVLLTRLALDPGRPVPADTLVRAIWEQDEPGGAANALQSLVSRLRRMLGAATVTSGPAGYALALDPSEVDAHRFETAAARGRRLLADGDPAAAELALTEALGLWRGAALADAADAAFALGPATRLEEQRLTATEDRIDARLRLGRAADVVPELEQLAAEHPLRERLHAQLMTALDTVGRRADALAVHQTLRTRLADELGIDPSPELDAVYMAILRGEPTNPRNPRGGAGDAGGRGAGPTTGRRGEGGSAARDAGDARRAGDAWGSGGDGASTVRGDDGIAARDIGGRGGGETALRGGGEPARDASDPGNAGDAGAAAGAGGRGEASDARGGEGGAVAPGSDGVRDAGGTRVGEPHRGEASGIRGRGDGAAGRDAGDPGEAGDARDAGDAWGGRPRAVTAPGHGGGGDAAATRDAGRVSGAGGASRRTDEASAVGGDGGGSGSPDARDVGNAAPRPAFTPAAPAGDEDRPSTGPRDRVPDRDAADPTGFPGVSADPAPGSPSAADPAAPVHDDRRVGDASHPPSTGRGGVVDQGPADSSLPDARPPASAGQSAAQPYDDRRVGDAPHPPSTGRGGSAAGAVDQGPADSSLTDARSPAQLAAQPYDGPRAGEASHALSTDHGDSVAGAADQGPADSPLTDARPPASAAQSAAPPYDGPRVGDAPHPTPADRHPADSPLTDARPADPGPAGARRVDVSPASTAPRTPPVTNLTARLTSFVGRESDRARLADTLGRARLVSVVGPGGAGKTRITVETGARLLPEFPGGVWFVELASVHEADDIPQAVLAALGRREIGIITAPRVETQPGAVTMRDALTRIGELLAARRPTLLILDNCEHLVASAAEAADTLLSEAPTLRILTSTREPLGIDGEVLYPLGPLSLPPSASGDVAAALESPAVRLFADRAHAVRPSLVVDAANIGAVTEICRRLDGMPLAIELAAARTRSLTPTQIARRLDDRFRLLTGRNRTAMPRHQTLRAVVEWSWDLLDDRERTLLRRLSLFAGGATLEAAETVLADPDGELVGAEDVLDLLAGLVDKSLVDMFGTGEPRYRMLETIAAFAAERRDDTGADAGVARRHLAWCLELLERIDPLLRTGEQLDAFAVIAEEHDNIAVALRFAVDNNDARSAVRLVALMGWYWSVRGFHREAAGWLGDALALPARPANTQAEAEAGHPAPGTPHSDARDADASDPDAKDAQARVLAQWFLGMTLISSGRESEGLRSLMRGRWGLRHLPPNPSNPLVDLVGVMAVALRDFTSGTTETLDAAVEHPDPWIRAVADLIGAHLAINIGRGPDTLDRLVRARFRFLEIGDRWGRSSAAAGLAEVYRYVGKFDQAIAALDECLELVGELGSVEDVPLLLSRRGLLRLRVGDHEGARADMHAVLEVAAEGDTAGGVVLAHALAGDLARALGDREEAGRQYERALEELPKTRMVQHQLVACLQLSLAYHADLPRERGKARLALDAAVAAAVSGLDMPISASVGEGLAWYALHDGAPERAAELLGAAVALRGHRDLGSVDAERVTDEVRAAMAELSADAYDEAFARGAAMSQTDALDFLRRN